MRRTFINEMDKTTKPEPTTVNAAGGVAWSMSDQTRLNQLCMIGVTGNTYYANEKELISKALPFLEKIAVDHPDWLAEAIDNGRNKGYIRTLNLAGLVYLSMTSPQLFRDKFKSVVKTGGDLGDFIDLCHAKRGFGRAVKTAIIDWLDEKMTQFYCVKYRKNILDAVKIARPKPFQGREFMFDWLFEKSGVELPEGTINSYELAKAAIISNDWKTAISHITNAGLDYASLTSYGMPPKTAWDALGKSMGVFALLKHLKTLEENDFFKKQVNVDWLEQRFTVESLKKNKVFPFRLYIAYENVTTSTVKNLLADVLNEYTTEYDWSVWAGKTAICPDVSGSMTSPVSVGGRRVGTIPAVIAGMFSGFLYKGIKRSIVLPWATSVYQYVTPRADSIITHISNIKRAGGGGTDMGVALSYMINKDIKVDQAIFITDSMQWVGSPWVNKWIDYKKTNKTAKAILIRIDGNDTNPFPEDRAKKLDIFQTFGWSDNVLAYIQTVVFGKNDITIEED